MCFRSFDNATNDSELRQSPLEMLFIHHSYVSSRRIGSILARINRCSNAGCKRSRLLYRPSELMVFGADSKRGNRYARVLSEPGSTIEALYLRLSTSSHYCSSRNSRPAINRQTLPNYCYLLTSTPEGNRGQRTPRMHALATRPLQVYPTRPAPLTAVTQTPSRREKLSRLS